MRDVLEWKSLSIHPFEILQGHRVSEPPTSQFRLRKVGTSFAPLEFVISRNDGVPKVKPQVLLIPLKQEQDGKSRDLKQY